MLYLVDGLNSATTDCSIPLLYKGGGVGQNSTYYLRGGSTNPYEVVQGGGGCQKSPKNGVRTIWMPPNLELDFFCSKVRISL